MYRSIMAFQPGSPPPPSSPPTSPFPEEDEHLRVPSPKERSVNSPPDIITSDRHDTGASGHSSSRTTCLGLGGGRGVLCRCSCLRVPHTLGRDETRTAAPSAHRCFVVASLSRPRIRHPPPTELHDCLHPFLPCRTHSARQCPPATDRGTSCISLKGHRGCSWPGPAATKFHPRSGMLVNSNSRRIPHAVTAGLLLHPIKHPFKFTLPSESPSESELQAVAAGSGSPSAGTG